MPSKNTILKSILGKVQCKTTETKNFFFVDIDDKNYPTLKRICQKYEIEMLSVMENDELVKLVMDLHWDQIYEKLVIFSNYRSCYDKFIDALYSYK